jgi:hypothetical protein
MLAVMPSTSVSEGAADRGKLDRLQQVVGHHRHHHVQFKLPLIPRRRWLRRTQSPAPQPWLTSQMPGLLPGIIDCRLDGRQVDRQARARQAISVYRCDLHKAARDRFQLPGGFDATITAPCLE